LRPVEKRRVAPSSVEGPRASERRATRCAHVLSARRATAVLLFSLSTPVTAPAQTVATSQPQPAQRSRAGEITQFLAGGAIGLLSHEGGHLLFNMVFDAEPDFRRVEFHGIPFFAITHRTDLPPAHEFTISSAGFWVQHAGNEWLLTRRPRLRFARAPVAKGVLAFNVLASSAYAGAAFARTGPPERDTRGMAVSSRMDERWVGALILAPAVLDAWRYFDPDARWPVWVSRAVKVGGVLLVVRAAAR
jgi:hypothetical protein